MLPVILTIAGSDSGGGAGIQADLRTFQALGCFGTSVITAITAQNTQGVNAIAPAPLVREQLEAVLNDFEIRAIKIGMVWDAVETILELLPCDIPIVVDPVMFAKGGRSLFNGSLSKRLLARATLITPNLPEASALLGRPVASCEEGRELLAFCNAVLVKGGHSETPGSDCLHTPGSIRWFRSPAVKTINTHGTGCTYSSAIAAYLGRGLALEDAVSEAKVYLHKCLEASKDKKLGKGIGACSV